MNLTNIIKRNMPVFVIGVLTVVVFLGIVLASQKNPPVRPGLKTVDEKELITSHSYILGNEGAPVTLTEFSDFGCPACAAFQPIVKSVVEKCQGNLRVIYRHFPLPQHKNSEKAAQAAQIAGEQGKFWEYGDLLFQNQEKFEDQDLIKYAEQLNLDTDKFQTALKSGTFANLINEDIQAGKNLGINSTPTFFLNGKGLIFQSFKEFEDQVVSVCQNYQPVSGDKSSSTKSPVPLDTQELTPIINSATNESSMSQEELDKKYGVLRIDFTSAGFKPTSPRATLGQLVRWTNKSTNTLVLEQTTLKFKELEKPMKIEPGNTFELRLYKSGYWSYRDATTLSGATLQIVDPKNAQ